jgi:hypothetical protein
MLKSELYDIVKPINLNVKSQAESPPKNMVAVKVTEDIEKIGWYRECIIQNVTGKQFQFSDT